MSSAIPASPSASLAERRPMTIMFCDLAGSTALSARLDPEDMHDILASYQRHATGIIEAAGGVVARYQGDGILVYFGHPAAQENDAERAIGAGLELARGFRPEAGLAETLTVRVGIASGVLLVGTTHPSKAADNHPVTGEAANLAAKLQELAGLNEVVICDVTQRLAGGLFEYHNLGLLRARSLEEPVQAWRVLGRSRAASRFQALRSAAGPCIGRDSEINLLLRHWDRARAGSGRVVVISGEAGVGKSRLTFELIDRVRGDHARIVQYDCSPQHQNSVLYPFLDRVRRTVWPATGKAEVTLEHLQSFLPGPDKQTGAAKGLLAELLGLAADPSYAGGPDSDAQHKRAVLFDSLIAKLLGIAIDRPVLIVVEDAHWIDPTSRELLDLCVDRIREHPVLLIVTCRTGFGLAWVDAPHATTLNLKPIGAEDAELLIKSLPGAEALPEPTIKTIAGRADGIPLFLEELTKAVVEGKAAAPAHPSPESASGAIPSSLHASLTERLDRLGPAREVASVAAAIGREFRFDLLRAVLPDRTAEELRALLAALTHAGLLSAGDPASGIYEFRHALIQDAAYALLPRGRRRTLHQSIATALNEKFPESVALQPEVVASHYTKAGMLEQAIRHRIDAGKRSVRSSALIDAVAHFSEAIEQLSHLPASPERDRDELRLQLLLGPAVMATKGYASAETLRVFSRARELAGSTTTGTDERLEILSGLFNVHYGRAEIEQAQAVAHQHLALAQASGRYEARAYCFMGQVHLVRGEFQSAKPHFERAIEIFNRDREDPRSLGVYGSQYVVATAFLAGVYWALGDPEKATRSTSDSIKYATQSGHLVSIALALITRLFTPLPGGLKGDPMEAREALDFCARHGLGNFEIWARFATGAVMARRDNLHAGIETMQSAIDAAETTGSRLFRPVQLATVASAYARLGDTGKALALADQALEVAHRTGEKRVDSALHRLRGELLIARNKRRAGRADLLRAIEIARAQHAVSEAGRAEKAYAKLFGTAPPRPSWIWRHLAALRTLIGA